MLKAVIFDLDETLLTRTEAIRAFIADQYERHRADLPGLSHETYVSRFLEIEQNGVINKRLVYPALVEQLGITQISAAALLADYEAIYPDFATLTAGARDVLTILSQHGFKLAIISNGNTVVQQRKIDAIGIRPLLQTVLVSETEGLRKPDPLIFLRAAERLGVPAAECLFVGDNPEVDIIGADAVGMQTAFFVSSTPWPEGLALPGHRITALTEVLPLCGIS
ncbi:MAG: HAD-superfamily hydrolase, subfamily variant 1 [Hyphomicrobiales bacterium]|nr:HAD-superfamily hydrolase, subfamily variant 1 [Hyphomicrobiales bacterium]